MYFLFRDTADAELTEAWTRYAHIDDGLGTRFLDDVQAAIERALQNPEGYQRVTRNLRCVRLRKFPHGVYFRVVGDTLIVVSIFHPSRDPTRLHSRD